MRRRWIAIIALVAIVVAAGTTVGVVEARAQSESTLAATTPAQLLANVRQHAGEAGSVSGDISWTNDVLGLSMLSFGGQGTGDLTALLSNGTGRVWAQGGKIRIEIQGTAGDTTITADATGIWVYQAAGNKATQYALPSGATRDASQQGAGSSSAQSTETSVTDPVSTIEGIIQKLAPNANLTLGDPVKVAGQTCYLLSLTPTAENTVFGSVQVAIDGTTYLPLRIGVYAKGGTTPVLSGGFTSVSYDTIADSIFAFTPPATATVEHKTLSLPGPGLKEGDTTTEGTTGGSGAMGSERPALSLAEAATQAGFTPVAAQTNDPSLAFAGAYVIPAKQVDLQSLLSELQSASPLGSFFFPTDSALASGPVTLGPAIVQLYGQGFGTVMLVEAAVPSDLAGALEQTLASVPLIGRTTAGGVTIYEVNTALGSIAIWDTDGHLHAAAGSVSTTQLQDFIANVR